MESLYLVGFAVVAVIAFIFVVILFNFFGLWLRARIQVLSLAGRQVIHHDDVVAGGHTRVDDVRADEARPARHEDLHAGCSLSRKNWIVRRSPSSRPMRGSQPSSFRARVMSGCRTFGSSSGSGRNTTALLLPASRMIVRANSRIVTSCGFPQFTGPV